MNTQRLGQIPKVIIGNPETSHIAYDVMPNYLPGLAEGVMLQDGKAFYHDQPIRLEADEARLISLCDKDFTLADILDRADDILEESADIPLSVRVYSALKSLRSLGLVERDNKFKNRGIFIRLRELDGEQKKNVRWIYLPPFAQRVFELCSGSYSVGEISQKISKEFNEGKSEQIPSNEGQLQKAVFDTCKRLLEQDVITWIDDEGSRRNRLLKRLNREERG